MNRHLVQDFYDRRAAASGAWYAGMLDVANEVDALFRDRSEKRTLSRLLGRRVIGKAVEVGCGSGRWLPFLVRRAELVVGVDLSLGQIVVARRWWRSKGSKGRVCLLVGDGERALSAAGFDLIYLSGMLLYLDDDAVVALGQWARRSLAAGGLLVTRDSIALGVRQEREQPCPAVYRTSLEYQEIFERLGFRLVSSSPTYRRLRRPEAIHRFVPRWVVKALLVPGPGPLRAVDWVVDRLAEGLGRRRQVLPGPSVGHVFHVFEKA